MKVNDERVELPGVECEGGYTCGKKFREFSVGGDKYELLTCTPNMVGVSLFCVCVRDTCNYSYSHIK